MDIVKGIKRSHEKKSKKFDVFICHAHEDHFDVALPLKDLLSKMGINVWLDRDQIKLGDNLRSKIDKGLFNSRFGVIIISPYFLKQRKWIKHELKVLLSRSNSREKIILPILHKVDINTANRILDSEIVTCCTDEGLKSIAWEILRVVKTKSEFIMCPECKIRIKNEDLKKHLNKAHYMEQCPYCISFVKRKKFLQHLKDKHNVVKCHYCSKVKFLKYSEIESHNREIHGLKSCYLCKKQIKKSQLISHIWEMHICKILPSKK